MSEREREREIIHLRSSPSVIFVHLQVLDQVFGSMIHRDIFVLFVISISTIDDSSGLECYVCHDQEHNREKCIRTVRTCEPEEDRCMSEVKWGSTLDWNLVLDSQFYVYKRCVTKQFCEEAEATNSKRCNRLPYEDWECVECCTGDRCNYFITLAAQSLPSSLPLTLAIISLSIFTGIKFVL